MSILRAILKVASKDRKVRRLLINEIRKTAGEPSYKDYVDDKKKKGEPWKLLREGRVDSPDSLRISTL